MIARLNSQSKACPDQKFALVGYSQGAAVMHYAANDIPAQLFPKIVALVMTGDPAKKNSATSTFPTGLREKELNLCATGDPVSYMLFLNSRTVLTNYQVCMAGDCFFNHLYYIRPEYVQQAVEFIVERYNASSTAPTVRC